MPGPFSRSRVLLQFRMAFKKYSCYGETNERFSKRLGVRVSIAHRRADSAGYEGLADYRAK